MHKSIVTAALLLLVPAFAAVAWAQDASGIDSGDTAWLLVSTALVMLMTPAWRCSTVAWCAVRTCWAP